MERLQKVIASSGVCSRRKAEELIKNKKVMVNGKTITEMGFKVSGNDEILVDGNSITKEEKVYYILNKPRGYVCTNEDDKKRKVVTELINESKRIYPVGRLDYDTTGLLLLTNDGDLTNKLTHPSSNIEKVYLAKVEGFVSKEELAKLNKGVIIDGKKTKKAKSKLKRYDKKNDVSYVYLIITEGRNHQVKNMFNVIGHEVLKLKREEYSFLNIIGLKTGESRKLSLKEVKRLYNETKKH